jgi:hypothetical protein
MRRYKIVEVQEKDLEELVRKYPEYIEQGLRYVDHQKRTDRGSKPDKQKCWVVDVETIRENDYYLNANRYAPYKVEEVEYEDPTTLMEELISK